MKTARILCIDGGGIRGLIPASILSNWEAALNDSRIADRFHMLAGTSTGGILATALAAGRPAHELVDFYKKDGPKIFSNTLGAVSTVVGEMYDSGPLEESLKTVFGDAMLSTIRKDLLVTAYEMGAREPRLFKSWRARGFETTNPKADDFPLTMVTRATSAAPTYFQAALVKNKTGKAFTMVDGGVYANNPAMCAYVAARRLYPMAEEYLIVSLGTGALVHPYTFEEVASWGIAGWAQPLLDVMFSGVSDTTTYQLDQLAPEVRQYRFQTSLEHASEAMDDATPENLSNLVAAAQKTVLSQAVKYNELHKLLLKPLDSLESLGYPTVQTEAPRTFSKPVVLHNPTPKKIPTTPTESPSELPTAVGAMGGAAIGGALGGPVGAIVGAVVGGIVGHKSK